MLFIPENRDDISRYYRHSFLKFKEHGDLLFYLDSVDRYTVTGKVEDGREFKLYLSEEHPYEVDYILPHKSFFQYNEHAVLLERVPARQYHRGITSENTILRYRHTSGDVGHAELSFNSLRAFVTKQKFFSLKEAISDKSKKSYVLNSRMMYVPSIRQIYVDFEPIARVDDTTKQTPTIKMIKPLFKHELLEALKSNNETLLFTINE
jgi:hypothetical protein